MDRITFILGFQWRAYWRRVQRPKHLTTNNAGVWILFGGIGVLKYLQQLPVVAAQLARNETARYETLLMALFLVWMFSVMAESRRSITSQALLHTPLTSLELFWIRLGSVFISPAPWVIAACSLALCYPLSKATHPATGIVGLLLFILFALAMGLTIAHVLSSANIRKLLLVAVVVASAVLGGVWLAQRRVPISDFAWRPNHLAASAAVAPEPSGPLAALAVMMVVAFVLALWSFTTSLRGVQSRRSQRLTIAGVIEFPGRLGGLIKKDLRYFIRLLDFYFALPIVILFISYLAWSPEPSASVFSAVILILFLPCISVASNYFGLDSPQGLDRYALFPLSGRQLLLSKNLAFALLFIVSFIAILPFVLWRFGVGVAAFGFIELVLVVLAYSSWGNWMSVRAPYKMQFYRFSAGGSPADVLLGLLFGSLPGVILVLLLYRENSGLPWFIVLMMALYLGLYYLSITTSGRRFEERREAIREVL